VNADRSPSGRFVTESISLTPDQGGSPKRLRPPPPPPTDSPVFCGDSVVSSSSSWVLSDPAQTFFAEDGHVLTDRERLQLRSKSGMCPKCGTVRTHQRIRRALNPLRRLSPQPVTSKGKAYKGHCLRCHGGICGVKLILGETVTEEDREEDQQQERRKHKSSQRRIMRMKAMSQGQMNFQESPSVSCSKAEKALVVTHQQGEGNWKSPVSSLKCSKTPSVLSRSSGVGRCSNHISNVKSLDEVSSDGEESDGSDADSIDAAVPGPPKELAKVIKTQSQRQALRDAKPDITGVNVSFVSRRKEKDVQDNTMGHDGRNQPLENPMFQRHEHINNVRAKPGPLSTQQCSGTRMGNADGSNPKRCGSLLLHTSDRGELFASSLVSNSASAPEHRGLDASCRLLYTQESIDLSVDSEYENAKMRHQRLALLFTDVNEKGAAVKCTDRKEGSPLLQSGDGARYEEEHAFTMQTKGCHRRPADPAHLDEEYFHYQLSLSHTQFERQCERAMTQTEQKQDMYCPSPDSVRHFPILHHKMY